jgi:predicted membrane protein
MWWALAPRVSVVITPDRVFPENFQPQEYFAANIAFGAIGATAGVLMAIGLVSMRREHLLASLIAALASAVVGTCAMWWVGSHLGFVDLASLDIPDSTVIDAPLEVTLPAMFLMWSLGSSLVILIMAIGDFLAQQRRVKNHSA